MVIGAVSRFAVVVALMEGGLLVDVLAGKSADARDASGLSPPASAVCP